MRPDLFKTDIRSLLAPDEDIDIIFDDTLTPSDSAEIEEAFETRIQHVVTSSDKTTKDIGNLGEALICGHEKMRLKLHGYEKFVRLVQIVDSPSYHPGFDIDSYEADGTEDHRYIEVKTTISKQKIQMYGFHMSPNEWRVAGTIKSIIVFIALCSVKGKRPLLYFETLLSYIRQTKLRLSLVMVWKSHLQLILLNLQHCFHGKDKSCVPFLWVWRHGFRGNWRIYISR